MEPSHLSGNTTLQALVARAAGLWTLDACGVTRAQTPIPVLVHRDAYAPVTPRTRLLLIGGLTGHADDVALAYQALDLYLHARDRVEPGLALSAIPCGNPDGFALGVAPENGVAGQPTCGYPPTEHFFYDTVNPECRYLWRWAGLQAADLLLEVRAGQQVAWEVSATALPLAPSLHATRLAPSDTLLAALGADLSNGLAPNGLGPIPGLRLTTPAEALATELERLWGLVQKTPALRPSPARRRLDARRARAPLAVARSLAAVYGHTLTPVVYTQGMSISARLRLARMDPTYDDPVPSIVQLVEPCVSDANYLLNTTAPASALAGLIWGMQLAEVTRDRRYADMMIAIADRYQPRAEGEAPLPCDADFRTEDMFMNGAMLGRAFRITGKTHYLDLLTQFLRHARIQQDDGLFWHSRSTPYYWGRGNGFALLGFSETLSFLPPEHPAHPALLAMHVRHLQALQQCQHPSGMFPQVLNVPGSYQEFTVTCMIGFAMARAVRRGWIDATYGRTLDLAWQGVVERIDDAGGLVDCCTNTGAQENLQAYIDRPAIFGRDDRGGSMAMWFALEMEQLARTR